jgi:hypothetical protein
LLLENEIAFFKGFETMIFGIFVLAKEQNIEMENKLNELAIDRYVEQFTGATLDTLFAGKQAITGDDILGLPIKQTGLFSLRSIFDSWQAESEKIRSVYFDYSDPAVENALKKMMNVLSNHILISRNEFEPIYDLAVRQSIYLIFSPYHYYESLLRSLSPPKDLLKELNKAKKFIKANKSVLESLISLLEEQPDMKSEELLSQVFGNIPTAPDDIQQSLDDFSEVVQLTTDILYLTEVEDDVVSDSLADNTYFVAGEIETVNEQFSVEERVTLADTLAKDNQDSIKTMLTINQKFMFINDLFDGNQDDFIKVIEFLDDCETEVAAMGFIQNNYIKKSLWRSEAPSVKEFLKLVQSKFS